MTKERITMKEIFSGLDHHWSSSAPLLMREYLHAAANNLVGFIKMDAVDKGSPAFRAQQLRESGMNWCYGFCIDFVLEVVSREQKAWIRSKAWMGRGACMFGRSRLHRETMRTQANRQPPSYCSYTVLKTKSHVKPSPLWEDFVR
jgi:hypothetical protein